MAKVKKVKRPYKRRNLSLREVVDTASRAGCNVTVAMESATEIAGTYGQRTVHTLFAKGKTRRQFSGEEIADILDTAYHEGNRDNMAWANGVANRLREENKGLQQERSRYLALARRHKNHADLLMEKHGVRLDDIE